ncbi:hypothetical protein BTZ20_4137 [Rhodococcus sp. MTM3W5.2]|nr:hypothetical protein BTZ20_4137 [Rhodococcus sp. MTM3W5.2]
MLPSGSDSPMVGSGLSQRTDYPGGARTIAGRAPRAGGTMEFRSQAGSAAEVSAVPHRPGRHTRDRST